MTQARRVVGLPTRQGKPVAPSAAHKCARLRLRRPMIRRSHLLLLPGMLSDEAFWRAQIDALADVCIIDAISYGLSDSIDAMAQAVLADAPERFALAGHSMGGRVALEVYKRAPHGCASSGCSARITVGTSVTKPGRRRSRPAKACWRSRGQKAWKALGGMGRSRVAPDRLRDKELVADIVKRWWHGKARLFWRRRFMPG